MGAQSFLHRCSCMQAYILFLGPPFVGKSTQTNKVREKYNAQLLSTADILRESSSQNILTNIEDENGRRLNVAELNARGFYTDAETVLGLVRNKIQSFDGAPIVSDSYPRSVDQLKDFQEKLGLNFAGVFYLRASSNEAYWKIFERRREARKYCPLFGCNTFFDPITNPANGVCPKDGTQLIRRKDDEPEVARKRFDSYQKNAAPLVEALRSHKAFHEVVIDEAGRELSPEEIFEIEIAPHLHAYQLPAEAPA